MKGEVERGFVTSAKEVLPEAEKIAGQYVPRSTDDLSVKAANLVRDDIRTAERVALTGSDDRAVAVASELLKHYAAQAAKATDDITRNALHEAAAEVANTVARKLTESGRTVQAASILGRLTPEGQVRFAAKEIQKWNLANPSKKVPELTGEQAAEITTRMKKIQGMAEGEEKAIAFKQLQDHIHSLIPSMWWQKVVAVWKAGLLTGIKTSGLNIFSNISHAATEIAKDIPAAAADTLLSLLTGKRTLALTVRGLPSGIKLGVERGWRYLKTGYDSRDVAKKLDYVRVNFKSKAIQGYVDFVFRALGAEDQVFYYGALKRSLYNQAIAQGKNKGLKGVELDAFVKNLIESPTDGMSAYALADAETAVFQNKTTLGKVGIGIQKLGGGTGGFVVPFARTPSAVAMQVVNYSPAGVFIEIGKQIVRKQFDQRLLSQAIGRSTIGTGVLWAGGQLFNNDLMTLDYPQTEKERELWRLEGRKANSIKVGDEWRTVQTLGPAGPVMLLGGHFQNAMKEGGSHTEAIIKATVGSIKSFTEQTFLRGVKQVMEVVADPQIWNVRSFTSSFISSFIPTIINDVARALDPKERRPSSDSLTQEVLNRIQARIPKLREGLEPQVDVLGQEVERIGNPLEVMFDPTRPSPEKVSPVIDELRRLTNAGFKVSPSLLGDRTGFEGLTPEQNTKLWRLAGDITNSKLGGLFVSESYKKKTDEEKGKKVKEFVEKSQINARAAIVLELTEELKGDQLRAKLSELKAGGLLTRDVYTKYQDLR